MSQAQPNGILGLWVTCNVLPAQVAIIDSTGDQCLIAASDVWKLKLEQAVLGDWESIDGPLWAGLAIFNASGIIGCPLGTTAALFESWPDDPHEGTTEFDIHIDARIVIRRNGMRMEIEETGEPVVTCDVADYVRWLSQAKSDLTRLKRALREAAGEGRPEMEKYLSDD